MAHYQRVDIVSPNFPVSTHPFLRSDVCTDGTVGSVVPPPQPPGVTSMPATGNPCKGDHGSTLMVKEEKEKRYMVAGVLSRCKPATEVGSKDCCLDPVVYEGINEEIKSWIWQKAPGVRETIGCPKKKIQSMIYLMLIYIYKNINLLNNLPSCLRKQEN